MGNVPSEVLVAIKSAAKEEWPDDSDMQQYYVDEGIRGYLAIATLDFGPALAVKEQILAWADDYSDVWEGEGRSFRYPVTVLRNGETEKRRSRFDDLQAEELITGHYRFGANELSIHRALVKIIDMLEADYGLKVPR